MTRQILLHTCCAPCSAPIIEWLLSHNISPVLFYFNPNIYPREEYDIRKAECTRYAQRQGLQIIDGDYDHDVWLKTISGLESQPERGLRCLQCFKMRLLQTAQLASAMHIKEFTTTLASSRWKRLDQIFEAGVWAASQYDSVEFWDKNWRKEGLSERRRMLLAEHGFYNQQYCGCEFSIREKLHLP